MFYSKSTGGFYTTEIHGNNIPSESVEITSEQYDFLLEAQSQGKQIVADDKGFPVAIDPPPLSQEQLSISALTQRDSMLRKAATRVSPLQDAVDLGVANDDEKLALSVWKQYRVALNRIEQQEGFPQVIDWPEQPS